jgi:hypothetical protein
MADFSKFKANRDKNNAKLKEASTKLNSNQFARDERYWQPVIDAAGSASAVIRFLPAPGDEELPWAKIYEHAFKRAGGWYIENSRSTLGQGEADPVLEYNTALWETGEKDKKALVSGDVNNGITGSKRKLYYISGIRVISHKARPEDEGKVFLFKYGKKIMDKITEAQNPDEALGEEPINPFDFWKGANFSLIIRKVEGQRNYDKSKFQSPSPISDDEDEMEAIWKSQYSLTAEVAPDKFKSYDELKKRLDRVLGGASQAAQATRASVDEDDDLPQASAPKGRTAKPKAAPVANVEEDLDDEAFFKKLSEGDDD